LAADVRDAGSPVSVDVRAATIDEAPLVADILAEASAWVDSLGGNEMWRLDEISPSRLAADVATGLFFVAWCGGEAAGTLRFQLEDLEFWPDDPGTRAAYIHRLAVRRRFAGGTVSRALMEWAVRQARAAGRAVLRLDCDVERTALRAVYERFGFQYHSDRRVGPYVVARYEYPVGAADQVKLPLHISTEPR
jgi:GNAT superfamily N-acetyltransferase